MIFTLNYNLPTLRWSHVVLHTHDQTAYIIPPLSLIRGNLPSISHLQYFGCIPISPPGIHHWPLNIYLGSMWGITVFPSIPQAPHMGSYSRPVCWFNEEHFQALGGDFKYHKECQEISGMFNTFLPQIHVLKDLNHAFRRFATHSK